MCSHIYLRFWKKETINEPPVNVFISRNILHAAEGALLFNWLESRSDIRFSDNILAGPYVGQIPDGVKRSDIMVARDADGLYHAPPVPAEHRVVLRGEGIGPDWMQGPGKLVYKDGRYRL